MERDGFGAGETGGRAANPGLRRQAERDAAFAVHDMNFSAERFVVLATNRIGMLPTNS
jgi:hypothetical protein